MPRRYLTGHIPDMWSAADPGVHELPMKGAGVSLVTTPEIDLTYLFPAVRDQKAENCCAQSVRDSAYARARALGQPIAEPSQAFLYAMARQFANPRHPLLDLGSSLRDMFMASAPTPEGGAGWGLIPDLLWPEDERTTNVVPPDDCWRMGEYATFQGYALPDGSASGDAIENCLRRLLFPTVCFIVDERYAQIGSKVYDVPGGKVLGSHCQVIVGYSPTLDAFRLRNSWGTDDFGDFGYAWVSRRFVNLQTNGKWVVETTPARIGAS
jgi:hypothetical protein